RGCKGNPCRLAPFPLAAPVISTARTSRSSTGSRPETSAAWLDSALEGGGFELPVPDQKVAASGERQRGQALLSVPYAAGTGSSNLLCSSAESRANLSFGWAPIKQAASALRAQRSDG